MGDKSLYKLFFFKVNLKCLVLSKFDELRTKQVVGNVPTDRGRLDLVLDKIKYINKKTYGFVKEGTLFLYKGR